MPRKDDKPHANCQDWLRACPCQCAGVAIKAFDASSGDAPPDAGQGVKCKCPAEVADAEGVACDGPKSSGAAAAAAAKAAEPAKKAAAAAAKAADVVKKSTAGKKYILWDIQPGEGFNFRKKVRRILLRYCLPQDTPTTNATL